MKLLGCLLGVGLLGLFAVPLVFAGGDTAPAISCPWDGGDIGAVMATIRTMETGGNYTTRITTSTASGAYAFIDAAWGGYGGYAHAWQAPPDVQDAKAAANVENILDRYHDIAAVPVIWYLGHLPPPGSPEWDQIPAPQAGNNLTPRQYQQRWLKTYTRQTNPPTPSDVPVAACTADLPDATTTTAPLTER